MRSREPTVNGGSLAVLLSAATAMASPEAPCDSESGLGAASAAAADRDSVQTPSPPPANAAAAAADRDSAPARLAPPPPPSDHVSGESSGATVGPFPGTISAADILAAMPSQKQYAAGPEPGSLYGQPGLPVSQLVAICKLKPKHRIKKPRPKPKSRLVGKAKSAPKPKATAKKKKPKLQAPAAPAAVAKARKRARRRSSSRAAGHRTRRPAVLHLQRMRVQGQVPVRDGAPPVPQGELRRARPRLPCAH